MVNRHAQINKLNIVKLAMLLFLIAIPNAIFASDITITKQPEMATVLVGSDAQFSLGASGENLSYQWQYKPSNENVAWTNVTDSLGNSWNTSALTIPNTPIEYNAWKFRCLVSNDAASGDLAVSSQTVFLFVSNVQQLDVIYENEVLQETSIILKHPETTSVQENTEVIFTVKASGDNLQYTWLYKEPTDDFAWRDVPETIGTGISTDTLTITNVLEEYQGYAFRCLVTGDADGISNIAYLYVQTDELNSDIVLEEVQAPTNFVATADDGLNMTLTWENPDEENTIILEELNKNGEWVILSDNAISSFVRQGLYENTIYEYRIHAIDANGITSKYVYTTGSTPTDIGGSVILKHPENISVQENTEVQFVVEASGDNLQYTWLYKEPTNDFEWRDVPETIGTGIHTNTLIISNASIDYQGYAFRCLVTGNVEELSNIAYLYVQGDVNEDIVIEKVKAPSDFKASSGDSENSITLTWVNNESGENITYVLQVLDESGDWETLSENAISPYNHEGLEANEIYEYNIRAYEEARGYSDYVYTEGITAEDDKGIEFIKDTTKPIFENVEATATHDPVDLTSVITVTFESFDENYNSSATTLSGDTITAKVGDEILELAIIEMTKIEITSGEKFTFTLKNVFGYGELILMIPSASVVDFAGNGNAETSIPTGITVDDQLPEPVNNFKASGDSDLSMTLTFENPNSVNKVVIEELNASGEWVVLSGDATSPLVKTGLEMDKFYEYRAYTVSETGRKSEYIYATGYIPYDEDYIIIRNDNIKPVLSYVGINPETQYITWKDTLVLTIDATDANYNYAEADITSGDIIIKVSGDVNNDAITTITKSKSTSGETYEISITNVTGFGELQVIITENNIIDKAGNGNIETTFDLTPFVANDTITDTAPEADVDENVLTVTNKQTSIIEIVKVEYQYRESGETEFITATGNIIEDLDADTDYEVRTVVTDTAGNEQASQITTVRTESMDNSKITIIGDPTGYTSGDVTVIINYGGTNFRKEYSLDNTTWLVVEEDEITLRITQNLIVYARLSDSKTSTESVSYEVNNIDKQKPTIENVEVIPDGKANTKELNATGIKDEGVSGVKGYYVSKEAELTSATWTEITGTEFTCSVTENGTYYVWVSDNAGNVSDSKIVVVTNIVSKVTNVVVPEEIEIGVGEEIQIPITYSGEAKDITITTDDETIVSIEEVIKQIVGESSGETTITITITNYDDTTVTEEIKVIVKPTELLVTITSNGEEYTGEWTNQDVDVILETTGAKPSEYKEKVGIDGEWSDITNLNINTITGNGEITYDTDFSGEVYYVGNNSNGNNITTINGGNIIRVDKTAPTIGVANKDVETNALKVQIVGAEDNLSGIKEYEISIYKDDVLLTTYTGASGEITFSGLTSSTTYGIKYKITDNAGNSTELIDAGTDTTGIIIKTVTYDYTTNGGMTVTKESEEVIAGTLVDLTVTSTKTGYTFKGWSKTPDGEVLTSLVMPEEDITLYAIFKDEAAPIVSEKDYETVDGELDIIVKVEDDGSGVSDYAVTTDEGNPTEWFTAEEDENGDIRIPVPGTNKYYVWIRDIDGNYVRYEQVAIKDIFAPTGKITVIGDNIVDDLPYSKKHEVILDITAQDNECAPSDIKIAIYNEEDYKNITSYDQINWIQNYTDGGLKLDWTTTDGDGLKRIYIIFKDKAGNISMTIKEVTTE